MAKGFLDLPGELRNRVYELVVEHDRRVENITHCREPSRFIYNPSYRWKIQGARDWKRKGTGVRYYSHAGLAGVCRQVRREYLPLYTSQQHAKITLCAAYDDIEKIYSIARRKPIAKIILRVRSTDKTLDTYVNLFSLIREKSRSLQCEMEKFEHMTEEVFYGYRLLQRILDHKDITWLQYILEPDFFKAILFKRAPRHIKIVLGRKGAAQVCVKDEDQVRRFLNQTGVDKIAEFGCWIPGVTISVI